MQHMQELAGTITTMLNTEICCKFGCFVWPTLPVQSPSLNAQLQLGSRSLQATHLSPLKAGTDTKNAAKRQQEGKARQGKDVAKKTTHTHTQIESRKQEGAAAVESDVRSTLRQSLLRLTLSPFLYLALSLSLELRHCSSSTFTHTHTHTAAQEKREKAEKKGNRKT